MEKFNLKWNEFEGNATGTLKSLFSDNSFSDVTLVCDDNKQLTAHKVILSASSSFFQRILLNNPHQHPLIYLKGIRHQDLESVLKFIYLGEAEVCKNYLQHFLTAAKDLEIRGLSDYEIEKKVDPESNLIKLPEHEINFGNALTIQSHDKEIKDNKEYLEKTKIEEHNEENFTNLNTCVSFPTKTERDKYSCDVCEYQADWPALLKNHKQAKHDGIKFPCNLCENSFSFHSNLKRHKKMVHSEIHDTKEKPVEPKSTENYINKEENLTKLAPHGSLKRHKKTDTKEEPVELTNTQNYINNEEQEKLALHESLSKETESGKYPCDECEYNAEYPAVLKNHKQGKHEGIKFPCDFCDQSFSFQSNLNRHKRKAHSEMN